MKINSAPTKISTDHPVNICRSQPEPNMLRIVKDKIGVFLFMVAAYPVYLYHITAGILGVMNVTTGRLRDLWYAGDGPYLSFCSYISLI